MNQYNEVHELPADFDGVFRFTNHTDTEFRALWNSKEYIFPAMSTVPLIIPEESIQGIQSIRKKFAKKLALREWYNGKQYEEFNALTEKSRGVPVSIDPIREDALLAPFIQKCLEPLPVAALSTKDVPRHKVNVSEHTRAVGDKESLKSNATDAAPQIDSLPTE